MNKGTEELKEAAKSAGSGKWLHSYITPFGNHFIVSEDGSTVINLSTGDVPVKYVDFIVAANPAAVLELIAALEKTQAQSSKWLEAYHKAVSIGARYEERIAELEGAIRDHSNSTHFCEVCGKDDPCATDDVCRALDGTTEPMARQLSVKLPNRLQPGADGPDDWYLHSDPDGEYMKADDVIEAIRAAGGTVEGGE